MPMRLSAALAMDSRPTASITASKGFPGRGLTPAGSNASSAPFRGAAPLAFERVHHTDIRQTEQPG